MFSLSDLYAYRDGALSLDTLLEGLEDTAVKVRACSSYRLTLQSMIFSMLSLDSEQRPSFERILTFYRGTVFPEYFYTFFADYCLSLAETAKEADEPSADHTIRRLTEEWDSVQVYLTKDVSETPLKQSTRVDEGDLLQGIRADERSWTCTAPIESSRVQHTQLRLANVATSQLSTPEKFVRLSDGRGRHQSNCAFRSDDVDGRASQRSRCRVPHSGRSGECLYVCQITHAVDLRHQLDHSTKCPFLVRVCSASAQSVDVGPRRQRPLHLRSEPRPPRHQSRGDLRDGCRSAFTRLGEGYRIGRGKASRRVLLTLGGLR